MAQTGLATSYFTRGEVERGRALAAEVLAAAEARGDREQMFLSHVNVAVPEHSPGEVRVLARTLRTGDCAL